MQYFINNGRMFINFGINKEIKEMLMKRIWFISVFCIMALFCLLCEPNASFSEVMPANFIHGDTNFNTYLAELPASIAHGESLEVKLTVDAEPYTTTVVPMHEGLTYLSSSFQPYGKEMIIDRRPTTLSVKYTVNNDVTDHIVVRFHIFSTPLGAPQAHLLEYNEVTVKHNPGQWITMVAPTCYTKGLKITNCTFCNVEMQEEIPVLGNGLLESGHVAGEWVITKAPTNKTTGTQERTCTLCGITLETKTVPILSEIWPNNTACSLGLRFRDEAPDLTDKWYMYTPVDLTQDGVLTFPLIASNVHIIGTVLVTVEDGMATVAYKLDTKKIKVKEEFLTFLPDLASVDTVEPGEMEDLGFMLNEPFPVNEKLQNAGSSLMFLRLVIDYDIYADGVNRYHESMYNKSPDSL